MDETAKQNERMKHAAAQDNRLGGSLGDLMESDEQHSNAATCGHAETLENGAPNSNDTVSVVRATYDSHAAIRKDTNHLASRQIERTDEDKVHLSSSNADSEPDAIEAVATECAASADVNGAAHSESVGEGEALVGTQADSSIGSATNSKENEQPVGKGAQQLTSDNASVKADAEVRRRRRHKDATDFKRRKTPVDQLVDTLTPPAESVAERRRRSTSRRLLDEYHSESKPAKPKVEASVDAQGDKASATNEAEMLARALLSAKYEPGSLCIGRYQGHPYWPCMVTCEPETNLFTKLRRRPTKYNPFITVNMYHVLFFGPHPERGWLEETSLLRFESTAAFLESRTRARENFEQLRERKITGRDRKLAADVLQWYTVPMSREVAFESALCQIEDARTISTSAERLERYRIALPRSANPASAPDSRRSLDATSASKSSSLARRAASIGSQPKSNTASATSLVTAAAQVSAESLPKHSGQVRASGAGRPASHVTVKVAAFARAVPLQHQLLSAASNSSLAANNAAGQPSASPLADRNSSPAAYLRKRTLAALNRTESPLASSNEQVYDTDSDSQCKPKRSRTSHGPDPLEFASNESNSRAKRVQAQSNASPNRMQNGNDDDDDDAGETLEFIMAEDLELSRIGYRVFSPLKHSKQHAFCYRCELVTKTCDAPIVTCAGPCRRTFHRHCVGDSSETHLQQPSDTTDGAARPVDDDDLFACLHTVGTDEDDDDNGNGNDTDGSSASDSTASSCGDEVKKRSKHDKPKARKSVPPSAAPAWRCAECVLDKHVCALCNKREAPVASLLPIVVSPLRAKMRGRTPQVIALSKEEWTKAGTSSKAVSLLSKFNAADSQPEQPAASTSAGPTCSQGSVALAGDNVDADSDADVLPKRANEQLRVDTDVCSQPVEADGRVHKCKRTDCGRFYHKQCIINYWRLFPACQYAEELLMAQRLAGGAPAPVVRRGPKRKAEATDSEENSASGLVFTCPAHVCLACLCDDKLVVASCLQSRSVKRLECVRCPTAYHGGDYCIAAGSRELGAGRLVCAKHFRPAGDRAHEKQINITWCFVCSRGGTLLCCEMCPAAFHADCLELDLIPEPFLCGECQQGKAPRYGDIVWAKVGNYRWWPAEVQHPRNVPQNVRKMSKPNDVGLFPVRFYGSHDYFRLAKNRTFAYQEGDSLFASGGSNAPSKTTQKQFKRAIGEVTAAYAKWRTTKQRTEAETVERHMLGVRVKPPPYNSIKLNLPIGDVRRECDAADEDGEAHECECDRNGESPCSSDACMNRMLMYECTAKLCAGNCQNQRFAKRQYPKLTAFLTPDGRGWGLRTDEFIQRGQFVIEYVGELVDEEEAKRRVQLYAQNKTANYYVIQLDSHRAIDAGPSGNYARFANHSCNPNMETQKWLVNDDYRIGLFALRDIPAGAELTFNYHFQCVGNDKIPCRCREPNCSGFIGLRPQKGAPNGDADRLAANSGAKAKAIKRDTKPKRVQYEDDCFRCGESGGQMLMCSKLGCPKVYHLACVNQETVPKGAWYCPWHWCFTCGKVSFTYCAFCPNSFCRKHYDGYLYCLPPSPASDSREAADADAASASASAAVECPKLKLPDASACTVLTEAALKTVKLICWEHPEDIAEAWTMQGVTCTVDSPPECAKVRLPGATSRSSGRPSSQAASSDPSSPRNCNASGSDIADRIMSPLVRSALKVEPLIHEADATAAAATSEPAPPSSVDLQKQANAQSPLEAAACRTSMSHDPAHRRVRRKAHDSSAASTNGGSPVAAALTPSNLEQQSSHGRRSRASRHSNRHSMSKNKDLATSGVASASCVNQVESGTAAASSENNLTAVGQQLHTPTQIDAAPARPVSATRKVPVLSAVRLSFKLYKNRSSEANAE